MAPHLAMTGRSRHVNRPVTGRAKIAAATVLNRLVGAALNIRWRRFDGLYLGRPGYDRFDEELVIESRVFEVAIFFRDPLLETSVRLD